jgi:hypothetical protein
VALEAACMALSGISEHPENQVNNTVYLLCWYTVYLLCWYKSTNTDALPGIVDLPENQVKENLIYYPIYYPIHY